MKITYNHVSKFNPDKISAIIAAVITFQNENNNVTDPINNKLNQWKIALTENSILNNKWTKFKW